MKPKVGDVVVCIDAPGYGGAGWSEGHSFVVATINDLPYDVHGQSYVVFPKKGAGVFNTHIKILKNSWKELVEYSK